MASLSRMTERMFNRGFSVCNFRSQPVCAKTIGGAPTGVTGDVNVMQFPGSTFEYHVKGTQTLTAPVIAAGGLNVALDLTAADGIEITQGITSRSPSAFVIGRDAFYGKLTMTPADVSGCAELAFGFRLAAAYQANFDDYTDGAFLNMQNGAINIETILNNAATTTTDTTVAWADAATRTAEIYVSAAGVASYKIDGAAPTVVPAAFTFDAADVVVPAFFFLHAADVCDTLYLTKWEVGLQ